MAEPDYSLPPKGWFPVPLPADLYDAMIMRGDNVRWFSRGGKFLTDPKDPQP